MQSCYALCILAWVLCILFCPMLRKQRIPTSSVGDAPTPAICQGCVLRVELPTHPCHQTLIQIIFQIWLEREIELGVISISINLIPNLLTTLFCSFIWMLKVLLISVVEISQGSLSHWNKWNLKLLSFVYILICFWNESNSSFMLHFTYPGIVLKDSQVKTVSPLYWKLVSSIEGPMDFFLSPSQCSTLCSWNTPEGWVNSMNNMEYYLGVCNENGGTG